MSKIYNPSPVGAVNNTAKGGTIPPAGTASYTMAGIGASIKPSRSGNILVTVNGVINDLSSTVVADGIQYQISYGTGSAPLNGNVLTGTQVGEVQTFVAANTVTATDVNIPFSLSAIITGLVIGTTYWIDLAQRAVGHSSQYTLNNINVSVLEA